MFTTVAVQWNIYVQCGGLISLVIHVKYEYRAPCHIADCSDFVCVTYICINVPYKPIKFIKHVYPIYCMYLFLHIFGSNMLSTYCSWLCFGTCI